ncbi:MAG: beta-lactamase family protein [Flavobacteriales bacterium]|nr:beta-lactamase family protein [Flavobacteriales bacterium]
MSRILLFAISFITLASCQSKNRKIQEVVQKAVAQSDFNGLLYIEQNGEVLFNGSIRFTESELTMPNEDTPIYLASLSKVFTEGAALQLHDNGLINLSSSISDQGVNEHQQFGSLITPHHLLEMRSGLPREFSYGEEFAQVIYDELDRAGPFLDTLPDFELSFTPRSDEEYSNLNYWILGSMIEEVTDANPDRAFYDLIFDRLSMRSSGLVKSDTDVLHGYIFEDGLGRKMILIIRAVMLQVVFIRV